MDVPKNEAVNSSVMRLGGGSISNSGWVKRLRTSESLKRSFTRAFLSYRYNQGQHKEEPSLKKRATLLVQQNAAAYDCWIRRWQPLPLPQLVVSRAAYDREQQLHVAVASVRAMALMARSMGYSHSLRLIRKSTSLVAWA